jgi:hypothetical protein
MRILTLIVVAVILMALTWWLQSNSLWFGDWSESLVTDRPLNNFTQDTSIDSQVLNDPRPIKAPQNIDRSDVIKLDSAEDIRRLSIGSDFTLLVEAGSQKDILSLKVTELVTNANFTQVKSTAPNGSVALFTTTDSLTNIFIKTATGMFEYSGTDFSGLVVGMGALNLSDDIHEKEFIGEVSVQEFKAPKRLSVK